MRKAAILFKDNFFKKSALSYNVGLFYKTPEGVAKISHSFLSLKPSKPDPMVVVKR